jgi:hypothetical protein
VSRPGTAAFQPERVTRLQQRLRLPQRELAFLLAVHPTTIQRWQKHQARLRDESIVLLIELAERGLDRKAIPATVRRLLGLETRINGGTARKVPRDNEQRRLAWAYLAGMAYDHDELRQRDWVAHA